MSSRLAQFDFYRLRGTYGSGRIEDLAWESEEHRRIHTWTLMNLYDPSLRKLSEIL